MIESTGGQDRLQEAIRAAFETAAETGRLRGPSSRALEATLSRIDEKIGTESTDFHLRVERLPDQCLILIHTGDPATSDVVTSFMHHGGARKLGSARGWLLPLGGVPVNRWIRALRRVLTHERRSSSGEDSVALPVRFTVIWGHGDDLELADIG